MRGEIVTFRVIERRHLQITRRGHGYEDERNLLDDLVPGLGCHMPTKHLYSPHLSTEEKKNKKAINT